MQELQPQDPRQIGPYRLRARLGAGGMGRVYLGLSAGGRAVAVKVVRPELGSDPEFRARFRQEVAVARRVSGLFTAPVIDADLDGQEPWLATAFVRGPSLAEAVAEHGPLPAESVVGLAAGLSEGLCAIHAAGVVHRDLKPANVLLAEDGPRVIDFGISRAVEAAAGLTRTGLVVGSPGFMSPEQAEGAEVGPPSDIFSLGAVLAFAATGQGPFGVGSTPALVYRVVHGQANLEALPPAVRALAGRCLVKDPSLRPSAADVLAEAEAGFPATGWLPEQLTRTIAQIPTPTPWAAYSHPAASPWSSPGTPAAGASSPGVSSPGAPSPSAPSPSAPAAGTRSSAAIAAAGLVGAAGAAASLPGAGRATGPAAGADPASVPTRAASRSGSESLLLAPPAGSGPQPPYQGPPSQPSRPGRRRPRRGLALAVSTIAAALVGGGAAAVLVMGGSGNHPQVTQTEQPAAVVQTTSVPSSGPAASSSRPVSTPSGGSPSAHAHATRPAQVAPYSAPASSSYSTWSSSPAAHSTPTVHSTPTTRKSPTAPPTSKSPTAPPTSKSPTAPPTSKSPTAPPTTSSPTWSTPTTSSSSSTSNSTSAPTASAAS
jgi:serine/threonine protein kinase